MNFMCVFLQQGMIHQPTAYFYSATDLYNQQRIGIHKCTLMPAIEVQCDKVSRALKSNAL